MVRVTKSEMLVNAVAPVASAVSIFALALAPSPSTERIPSRTIGGAFRPPPGSSV